MVLITLTNSPAAEAKWTHWVKKGALLPVFWVFALPVSVITWWEVADEGKTLVLVDKK